MTEGLASPMISREAYVATHYSFEDHMLTERGSQYCAGHQALSSLESTSNRDSVQILHLNAACEVSDRVITLSLLNP